jgi:hypothetical protein
MLTNQSKSSSSSKSLFALLSALSFYDLFIKLGKANDTNLSNPVTGFKAILSFLQAKILASAYYNAFYIFAWFIGTCLRALLPLGCLFLGLFAGSAKS